MTTINLLTLSLAWDHKSKVQQCLQVWVLTCKTWIHEENFTWFCERNQLVKVRSASTVRYRQVLLPWISVRQIYVLSIYKASNFVPLHSSLAPSPFLRPHRRDFTRSFNGKYSAYFPIFSCSYKLFRTLFLHL